MEVKIDMGQIGYVSEKLPEMDISEENNIVVGDGTFAANCKTSETCYAELADRVSTSTDYSVGNDREESFVYSGKGMNLVLDGIDNENEVSKDCSPDESVRELGAKFEGVFNLTSNAKNKSCDKLSLDEQNSNAVRELSFTPPEQENVLNLAMICTPAEDEEGKEIARKLLSPELEGCEKIENFVYSEHKMNIVLDDDAYGCEKFKDTVLSEYENSFGRSSCEIDNRKDEKISTKTTVPSKCGKEKEVGGVFIYSEGANEINHNKLSMDIAENELEDSENKYRKVMNLSLGFETEAIIDTLEINDDKSEVSFTPPKHENVHNLAKICTTTKNKEEKEIAKKKLVALEFEEIEKQEHFIYAEHGIKFILAENKNGNQTSEECITRQCNEQFSSSSSPTESKSKQNMTPKITYSKSETEEDIGEISLTLNSVSDQEMADELDRYAPIHKLPEDKHEVQNKIDINLNSSEPEMLGNLNSSKSEQTDSSVENNITSTLSFSPPSRDIAHLAIISTTFESKAGKDTVKDMLTSESGNQLQIAHFSSIHPVCGTEQAITDAHLSPECNNHIGTTDFVCNECKCQVQFINDLSKVKENKKSSGYLALSKIIDEKRTIANENPSKPERKVIVYLKKPTSGDLKNQQDTDKDSKSSGYESRKISSVSSEYGKYARDNKPSRNLTNSRRGGQERFKPRSEIQKGRQVNEVDASPSITEKHCRGNYRPRYGGKPSSYTDVRGKFPSDRVVGKVDEYDKSQQVRRQPMASNTMNVNPLHFQQRGQGYGSDRYYPRSRFQKTRVDYY